MATERDSPRPTSTGHTHSTATVSAPREQADELATVNAGDAASLLAEHRAWWCDWWNASAVNLGEWQLIEKNYYTMMYLMRGSMRENKVAPGLYVCLRVLHMILY